MIRLRSWLPWVVAAIAVAALADGSLARQQGRSAAPLVVEPAELEHKPDLVGRDVVVDDRVAYYVPRNNAEEDELQLKRTAITFRVPRRLRPQGYTRMAATVVRGVLEREGGRLSVRVSAVEPKPGDLDRLKAAVAQLGPRDYQTRRAWAKWAERRAADFQDNALLKQARALDAEALRLESDVQRLVVDAPGTWLKMAREARARKVPEPEPSALAHRALRARLASAAGLDSVKELVADVKSFFPEAERDRAAAAIPLGRWEAPYLDDPAAIYREVPADIRRALDRRLWADAEQRLLDAEPIADLAAAVARADQAAQLLPEKSELPARYLDRGVAAARRDLGTLRLDEARALAEVLRSRLHRPDEAQKVTRDWLEARRRRLSATDADGRLALAALYEELVQDRVTAIDLLRKAWEIDPSSQETAQAFRTRGFRRSKDQWVEIDVPGGPKPSQAEARPDARRSTTPSLIGLTPDELEEKWISKPSFKNYVACRGQLVEQRVYLDTSSVRYVNLSRASNESKARVIADYTLPRIIQKGGPAPAR